MFDQEKESIEQKIRSYLAENDIPLPDELKWSSIPFSGEWGISTSFFQTAADEARSGKQVKVPVRAQEIAELVKAALGTPKASPTLKPCAVTSMYITTPNNSAVRW